MRSAEKSDLVGFDLRGAYPSVAPNIDSNATTKTASFICSNVRTGGFHKKYTIGRSIFKDPDAVAFPLAKKVESRQLRRSIR
jgi:hypothetical protein